MSKDTWWYIEFIFGRKLSFCQHIQFYANKSILTIKYMKILGNSIRNIYPYQKYLLYWSCALPITLYRTQLWYFKGTPISHLFNELRKIQRKAVLWITEAFHISSTWKVEMLAGLIMIHLYLDKLSGCHHLRVTSLPN